MKAYCTVVSYPYLPYARALHSSLRASGNNETLYVLIADLEMVKIAPEEGMRLLGLSDLADSGPAGMRYYFDAFEFCNDLKPFLVRHLFHQGIESVIYLDSDIMAVGSFERVWDRTGAKSLLLTPHHLAPPQLKLGYINEASIADMGFVNGGFAAWHRSAGADTILDWMCSRFPVLGFCDRRAGMFVDQKLLPLVLQYFPGEAELLRDSSLNVAFWNVNERAIECRETDNRVQWKNVVFFHMSGFRLAQPDRPCSYLSQASNEAILSIAPWFAQVLRQYRLLLSQYWWTGAVPEYQFTRHAGFVLTPDLRRILFRTRVLSRRDSEVQKVILVDFLKRIKRRLFPYRHA